MKLDSGIRSEWLVHFSGRECISPLIKCTSVIRQLAYDVNDGFLDEYMQVSERSSRKALDHFCQAVMEIYGPDYLRKPTMTDVENFIGITKKSTGFRGSQYVRCDHGSNPFILLEAIESQDLWIWHAFFGIAGSNNDINVLYQSPLFNDLKTGRAPEIPFVANGVTYRSGYYLVDRIYRNWRHSLRRFQNQLMMTTSEFCISKSRNRQGKMWNERLVFLRRNGQY
ncbi:ALP1-like protein isoform X1 [Tanacetum coccineum]